MVTIYVALGTLNDTSYDKTRHFHKLTCSIFFNSQRSSRAPARRPAPAAPARRAASTSAPAPRPAAPAPATTSSGGGMMSGIGSTIMQGMAFGTGSAIAHQAVGAVVGSMSGGGRSAEPTPVAPAQMSGAPQGSGQCVQDKQMFFDCLQQTKGDQQACSFLFENLQACQRNETTFQ